MKVIIQRFKKPVCFLNGKNAEDGVNDDPVEHFEQSFSEDKKGEKAMFKYLNFFKKDQEEKADLYHMKVSFHQEQLKINFPPS